jgi:diguanylate cyclase (GGDEF)-like protein
MKTSIKKLLSTVQFNAMLLMLMTVITALLLASSIATFNRIDNMALQEKMVKEIARKDRTDPALDRIQVEGTLNRLPILIDRLESDEMYEFVNSLFFGERSKRSEYGSLLREKYRHLADAAIPFFNIKADRADKRSPAVLQAERQKVLLAVDAYVNALYPMTKLQNATLYQYFFLAGIGLGLILLWSFVVIFASNKASRYILSDIHALVQQDSGKRMTERLHTSEINTLAIKLRQDSGETALAPSKKDDVTQLPNYDGVKTAFDLRAPGSKKLQTFVCVFEIDNYPKLANHFPQSVIDPILIKIASIMKLHQMQNDQIGRIQGGQFIAVFVRQEKDKALDDSDHIRQMIEENRFKLPHNSFPITVSGGFAGKMATQTLDDAVKNAREYLRIAQQTGGNAISQAKNSTKIL